MAATGAATLVDAPAGPATSVIDRDDLAGAPARPAVGPALAGGPAAAARRFRVPVAVLVAVVFVALLVAGLNRGDRTPSNQPAGAETPTTAAKPATTAASPTASLAAELRTAAGKLSASDGARAADLATTLRQVADQVQAGNGGASATGAIVAVGAWRLTGQLSDATAASAIALLSRVPGATVVNLPSQPVVTAPAAPAAPSTPGGGKAKGKDKGD
jgi:hypothetical protein